MKLTTKLLKQMIAEEMNNKAPLKEGCGEEQEVSEGMENITPENLQLVLNAVVKMAGVFGPAIMAAISASALYKQIMGRKAEIDQEAEAGEIPEGANFIKENK